ncbi:MAG TPA: hypothetical protein VFW09_06455 [Solirubrobacteraceae bacterium]|nr:hypothetical protein [Solirubrobacteraceae bacterium]
MSDPAAVSSTSPRRSSVRECRRSRAADPLSCPGGREPDRSLTRRVLDDAGLPLDRLVA